MLASLFYYVKKRANKNRAKREASKVYNLTKTWLPKVLAKAKTKT